MKKIPTKNYIILGLIFIVSITISLYISSWYKMTEELKTAPSIFTKYSLELKLEELDTYLVENPNTIIYLSNKSDKKIEKEVYNYIYETKLINDFIYINLKEYSESEITSLLKSISKIKIYNNYPNIYMTEDSKITSSLLQKDEKMTISKVKKYIEKETTND